MAKSGGGGARGSSFSALNKFVYGKGFTDVMSSRSFDVSIPGGGKLRVKRATGGWNVFNVGATGKQGGFLSSFSDSGSVANWLQTVNFTIPK